MRITLLWLVFHMQYFLYLRRSLTRVWRAHVLLVLLVTCAMAFPICLSILESGYVRGALEDNIRRGVNHDVRIDNAMPGDEVYFRAIVDGDVFWENDKLFIDAHKALTKKESSRFADKARLIANANPERDWVVNNLAGLQEEEAWYRFSERYHLAVVWFATFLVCLAFGNFWRRQMAEVGKLKTIGAQNHQIALLYFVHYVLIMGISTVLSVASTVVFLKIMTMRFLGYALTGADPGVFQSLPKFVFSIEWHHLLPRLGRIWAVSCAFFAVLFTVYSICMNIQSLLKPHQMKPLVPLRAKRSLSGLLRSVFMRKSCLQPLLCAILALPLLIAAILLLQRQTDTALILEDVPEYGITAFVDGTRRIFNTEDLRDIENLPGVSDIRYAAGMDFDYLIRDENGPEQSAYNADAVTGYKPYIQSTMEMLPKSEVIDGNTVYYAAIASDDPAIQYEIGTILELVKAGVGTKYICVTKIMDDAETAGFFDAQDMFTIWDPGIGRTCLYKNESTKEEPIFCDAYHVLLLLAQEDVDALTAFQKVESFDVKITDFRASEEAERAILQYFAPGELVYIENHYTDSVAKYNRAVGMNLLYTTLSALLFAFFAIITTLSLIDYAASHRETIRLLHMQGAPHRSIIAAFVEIMLPPGILTCAAVWAIVTPVEREYYRLRGYTDAYMPQLGIRLDDPLYLAAAAAVVAVFVAPVICTVVRQLRRLDRG